MNKKRIVDLGKDEKMDLIGIPINPHKGSKQSLKSEFWTELGTIFTGNDDMIGVFMSIILAFIFVIRWLFFLMNKYLLRLNMNKPAVKKKK